MLRKSKVPLSLVKVM